MTSELTPRRRGCPVRVFVLPAVMLVAGVLVGCGVLAEGPLARSGNAVSLEYGIPGTDPTHAMLAYYREIREIPVTELRHMRRALGDPGEQPLEQMRQAILLSHPATANLPRAVALLEAVMASDEDEALAVHSLARVLHAEVHERLRLAREFARTSTTLKDSVKAHGELQRKLEDSEKAHGELQRKLEALTEIERTLPARPSPDAALPPQDPERREAQ
jgi:hypothetical protein